MDSLTSAQSSTPSGSYQPSVVSLFTGCGGSDAGLIAAGFEIIFATDISAYAKDVYEANLPETDYRCTDIRTIASFPKADILVGCYPCQGFSQGGARVSDKKVNYLYREFDRALRDIRPLAFVVENVPGMQRSDFAHLLKNQLVRFRLAGYSVSYRVLDAASYGVPQHRKRIFIVGTRSVLGIRFEFPEPTHTGADFVTVKNALAGMPEWPTGEFLDDEFHWHYMSRNRRCEWDQPSKTILSNARHMPLHPISPTLVKIHADKWEWESDSPARRFSYREASSLQGFERDWIFPEHGSIRQRYKAIGNAVPPALFTNIGLALRSALDLVVAHDTD